MDNLVMKELSWIIHNYPFQEIKGRKTWVVVFGTWTFWGVAHTYKELGRSAYKLQRWMRYEIWWLHVFEPVKCFPRLGVQESPEIQLATGERFGLEWAQKGFLWSQKVTASRLHSSLHIIDKIYSCSSTNIEAKLGNPQGNMKNWGLSEHPS